MCGIARHAIWLTFRCVPALGGFGSRVPRGSTSFGRSTTSLAKTECTSPSPTYQSACKATRMLIQKANRGERPFRLTELAGHTRARLPKQTGAVAVGASLPHSCFLEHEDTAYNHRFKPPRERAFGVHPEKAAQEAV